MQKALFVMNSDSLMLLWLCFLSYKIGMSGLLLDMAPQVLVNQLSRTLGGMWRIGSYRNFIEICLIKSKIKMIG